MIKRITISAEARGGIGVNLMYWLIGATIVSLTVAVSMILDWRKGK